MYAYFVDGFYMMYDNMCVPINVLTLIGDPLVVDRVYQSCPISLAEIDSR